MEHVTRSEKNGIRRFLFLSFLFFLMIYSSRISVHAAEKGSTTGTELSIEVENRIQPSDGKKPDIFQKQMFVFGLEPTDEGSPMPAVAEAAIRGSGKVSFGSISFLEPGIYHYTLFQKTQKEKDWMTDSRQYQIEVTVRENTSNQLFLTVVGEQEGIDGKTDAFQFENTYRGKIVTPPSHGKIPPVKTGDQTSVEMFLGILLLSGVGIVLFWDRKRKKREREER